jgi:hypothetical protein
MPLRTSTWRKSPVFAGLGAAALLLALSGRTRAGDEIQLYDASIAEVGQWTIQHHFNYTFNSRRGPDFLGGLDPNHALNATPEFAYGVTPWFEFGFYIPWAVDQDGRRGRKLRAPRSFRYNNSTRHTGTVARNQWVKPALKSAHERLPRDCGRAWGS